MLLPVEEVAHLVATTTEFKSNCNLVITDFFIRSEARELQQWQGRGASWAGAVPARCLRCQPRAPDELLQAATEPPMPSLLTWSQARVHHA